MTIVATVKIDCFPESLERHADADAIVGIDVIRATTTAVTAVASGRRCFPVPSIESAAIVASRLPNALFVGELGGSMPYGFDMTNSPAEIEVHADLERPAILLSTSGTRLICGAPGQTMYVACLRNFRAQAQYLVGTHERVVLIGAGARNEFREEDAICCAWIAEELVERGFQPGDEFTQDQIERWRDVDLQVIRAGHSARYLHDTQQTADLEYVLEHVDDLKDVYVFRGGEIVTARAAAQAA